MKFDLLVLSKKRLGGNLKSLRWKSDGVGTNTYRDTSFYPLDTLFSADQVRLKQHPILSSKSPALLSEMT